VEDFAQYSPLLTSFMIEMGLSRLGHPPFNRHIVSGVNFGSRREVSMSVVGNKLVMCTDRESAFTTRVVPQHLLIAHLRCDCLALLRLL
jgi:hypothetical protein